MSVSDRYRDADLARLNKEANNPALSDVERQMAASELARKLTPTGWIDKDATCQWCSLTISAHTDPARPWNQKTERGSLGSSLCPVVRDNSHAGKNALERYYPTPTPDDCANWRASNLAMEVKAPTAAERKREAKERQTKLA